MDQCWSSDLFRPLLRCPRCGAGDSLSFGDASLRCSRCGASFSAPGGIVDFVAGNADTALDVAEYDRQKSVSLEASLSLFRGLKRIADGLIPDDLGTVLEIGAGTGLLSMGMIADSRFDRAVITDVSPAMLALVGARLDRMAGEKRARVALATYSGDEDILAPGRYDLVIANSVLHHILDYGALLGAARSALGPSGVAVFCEPGAAFHEALTLAMSDAMVSAMAAGADTAALRPLAAWVADTRFRLRARPDELAPLEDKHIFRREDLETAALEAGFARLTVRPVHQDTLGRVAVSSYMSELGVPDAAVAEFLPLYVRHAGHHFRALAPVDLCSMYLLIFHAA